MRTVLLAVEVLAVLAVAAGVALISLPAGLITLGVLTVAAIERQL